jgi:hypothetical protein
MSSVQGASFGHLKVVVLVNTEDHGRRRYDAS